MPRRGSSPKFQIHNTALISAQRGDNFVEVISEPDEWGRMVESAIGAYLINHAAAGGLKLYYWRERNDEVDFVLERKGKTLALEVKSGASRKAAGMSAFQRLFNPDKVLLIGDTGLPWQEFLKMDPVELF
jgi:predicted AAA+ superfamily ATPase